MKILNKIMKYIAILLIILLQFIFIPTSQVAYAATSPTLTDSKSYSVLGHSTVTNTGATAAAGDVGVSSGTSITGFPPGVAGGDNSVHLHSDDASAQAAQIDNATAYLALSAGSNATCTDPLYQFGTGNIDLAGKTLVPGVYCADTFSLSGTLTLDDTGAANGVWIFRAGSTLGTTAGVGAKVQFLNGIGLPCNVWWKVVSSATIGIGTTFIGNILALASVTLETSATLNGRAMAQTGAVTLDTNTISGPTCVAVTPTLTPTPTSTLTPTPTSSSTSNTSTSSNSGTGSASAPAAKIGPALNYIAPSIIESKRINANSIFISWGPYSGINTFIVQYGFENGVWLYNTGVTGFSTTINSLPADQPIWARIAARDDLSIGAYGTVQLVGAPGLPNTGFAPHKNIFLSDILTAIFALSSLLLKLICV